MEVGYLKQVALSKPMTTYLGFTVAYSMHTM